MRFQLKADDAGAITAKSAAGAVAAGLLAVLWAQGIGPLQECAVIFPSSPPQPTDAAVAALGTSFEASIRGDESLSVSSRGELKRDLDTTFWALLADHFGSNPNTPCTTNDFSSPICLQNSLANARIAAVRHVPSHAALGLPVPEPDLSYPPAGCGGHPRPPAAGGGVLQLHDVRSVAAGARGAGTVPCTVDLSRTRFCSLSLQIHRRTVAICVSPVPWTTFDEPVMIFICRCRCC